jgi:hypothetical protein
LTFGLGFGDPCGWGCGSGYFGGWPWYYGGAYPYEWRGHHGRGTHHHRGDPETAGAAPTPHPWLTPDHPRVPPHVAHVAGASVSVPAQPTRRLVDRHPPGSASFAPHAFEHMRTPRPAAFMEQPALATRPETRAFATPSPRPTQVAAPHFAAPPARPAPPMRVAPSAPPPRGDHAIPARIR